MKGAMYHFFSHFICFIHEYQDFNAQPPYLNRPCARFVVCRQSAWREVKGYARTSDDAFWASNCAQLVSVLLEAFSADNATNTATNANTLADGEKDPELPVPAAESMHVTCKVLLLLCK